jgi:hypothetical protein
MGQLGARYHDSRGSFRTGLFFDYDLYITVKGIQKIHQALHGKPLQAVIHQSRNFWLIDAEQARCCGLRQMTRLNDPIDGNRQAHSRLLFAGIAQAKIRKHVA